MKSLKAAAVVAGSLVVAGVAAPAVAQDVAEAEAAGLTGVVNELGEDPITLQDQAKVLDTGKNGRAPSTVKGVKKDLKQQTSGQLLGGRPVQI
jgi:hypothetical protein